MPPAPQVVVGLVERLHCNRAAHRARRYNETQLRREFLDPLFDVLGWEVTSTQGYAEAYREVYVVFVEKGLELLNPRGHLGFILPHKLLNAQYGKPLRGLIGEGRHLSEVVHFGDQQVFAGATMCTCLLFLAQSGREELRFEKVSDLAAWRSTGGSTQGTIGATTMTAADWDFPVGSGAALLAGLAAVPSLPGDVAERIAQGIRASANGVYVLDLVQEHGDTITAQWRFPPLFHAIHRAAIHPPRRLR